jgi:hypothetical protein
MNGEKKEGICPPPFSNHPIPHHQRNNSLKKEKTPHLPTLKKNQTSPSYATTQKTTLGLIPIPKKITSPNPTFKKILWKVVELSHPPLLTQKKPF